MKKTHKNITLIEEWLSDNKVDPIPSDELVKRIYHEVLEPMYDVKDTISAKQRRRAFCLQYDFVRRDLLKIVHKRYNTIPSEFAFGYVYAIYNPAWPTYVKFGSAIDVIDRLSSYQTSSPHRDYVLLDYYFVWDRLKEERILHSLYPTRLNEWCCVTIEDVKELFRNRKLERRIMPDDDKVYKHIDEINTKLNIKHCDWEKVLRVEDTTQ